MGMYSFDLEVHFCTSSDYDKAHNGKTFCLGRKSFEECLSLLKYLGIKEYRFCKRPLRPDAFGHYRDGMVDCCIARIYIPKDDEAGKGQK